MNDLDVLKEALAKGPTPGPWHIVTQYRPHNELYFNGSREIEVQITKLLPLKWVSEAINTPLRDWEYIAACSPDRISRLLAQLEEYEGALRTAVGYEPFDGLEPRKCSAVLAKWRTNDPR